MGAVVSAPTTWKTPESPYMGRVSPVPATSLPSMGSAWLTEELSRPMRTNPAVAPSPREFTPTKSSVPSLAQPVKG